VEQAISRQLADIGSATQRLLATLDLVTDAQAAEPSLLPGWTRGHVATHIARNADGLANLLRWARTGTPAPMYLSNAARDADIEAGAGRTAGALAADVRDSAAGFAAEAARVPADAWDTPVSRTAGGETFPARDALWRRLSELEVHHVDLATGYRPADWPAEFVARHLPRVASAFRGRDDVPGCRVLPAGASDSLPVGPDGGPGAPVVTGPPADLLAWLLGRGSEESLTVPAGGALPVLPAWR
jgi:maleylpyruvate isomerase